MSSFLISEELVPVDVNVDDLMIRVKFSGGMEIATPVSRFPRLLKATPKQRAVWRLIGKGDGIQWPDVDEDISVGTLLSRPKRMPVSREEAVPALIATILRSTHSLHTFYRDQTFHLDGSLASSVGKIVAEHIYNLKLEPSKLSQIKAHTQDHRSVQIKLTSGESFSFRVADGERIQPAEFLIALRSTGSGFEEIYNGIFPQALLHGRASSSNGQIKLAIAKLRELNPSTLPRKVSFESVNRWFTPNLADVA